MKTRITIRAHLATIFIAISALSTSVAAQKVYRCGSSYSQTPCPEAVIVEVEDRRSASQKSASEAQVRRDASIADAMEKQRLQEEAQAIADRSTTPPAHSKKKSRTASTPVPTTSSTGNAAATSDKAPPKAKGKKNEPAFFTARVLPGKKPSSTGKP